MAKTATQAEDEMAVFPNSYDEGSDPAGSQLARQQKLEKQKALMEQKKRQRQMQNGMVMASNLGSRPISSKNLRPSSRPQSLTSSSKVATPISTGLASPKRRLSSSSGSAPDEHDESALIPSVLHDCGVMATTSFSNSASLKSEQEKVSPQPAPNLTAAKLMAMGIASSLDYDSNSDKEDEAEAELSVAEGIDATMEETGNNSAMVAPRTGGATTAMSEFPLTSLQEHDGESSRNEMAQALMEQLKNIKEFVMKPAPEGVTIKCRITRQKRPSPLYLLHLEEEIMGSKIFLLAAQKRKRNRSSNYLLSIDQNDFERQSDNAVAKLRSNFVGTSFTVYDSGLNPEDTKAMPDGSNVRQELAAVHYETNVLGFKGPRKMTVILPGIHPNKTIVVIQPKTENETLLSRWKANQAAQLLALCNKQPVWSEETQAYVLNFHGRVTQASVKNFQLIHSADPNYVVVQFGRVSDDIFTLDYNFPASAVQAFAIALSSFDSKLACE